MNVSLATVFSGLLLCFSQQILATTNNDDSFPQLSANKVDEILAQVPDQDASFLELFEYGLEENGKANYAQRFGQLSKFTWTQTELVADHQFAADRARSKGKSYFADTIGESILSGFDSWFDFDRFKEVCSSAMTFGAKFAEGSLDPREGRLQPDSIRPENVISAHSWMYTFLHENKRRYGLKLLNNKPYVYYSRALGENESGMPFLIIDTRLRLTSSSSHAKRLRVDENLLFPIADRAQLSVGYRLFPSGFNSRESRSSLTIRLSYQLDKFNNYNDIVYFSAEINGDYQLLLVGFSLSKIFER